MNNVELLLGDSRDILKELEDNSVDSIVTDPPYEIGFMGKAWDNSGIAYDTEFWKECMRVLKPGGHLLAFSHSRTYHRMAVAVEDAGFEIRDQILWVYGSGFPKSHNIGKAVDKIQGNEREVIGISKNDRPNSQVKGGRGFDSAFNTGQEHQPIIETKGNSQYEGWGTALKPAHEPIVMGRKPFKGTVAENMIEWGTGGINIDGCRIGTDGATKRSHQAEHKKKDDGTEDRSEHWARTGHQIIKLNEGRFPANIIFDEEAGKILDEQTGELKPATSRTSTKPSDATSYKLGGDANPNQIYGDTGGASRFFYCPKASKRDRNEGCDALEEKTTRGAIGLNKVGGKPTGYNKDGNRKSQNHHPTVKPTDLLAYLVRLVTPKGGIVLDPFMGSGSTGKACMREGMNYIGIEMNKEYYEIAKARISYESDKNILNKFI